MTSCNPPVRALMSPNGSVRYIKEASIAASGGGGSSSASGSDGGGSGSGGSGSSGDGGNVCSELGGVSCLRRNQGITRTTRGLSDSTCPSSFITHAPMHAETSIDNLDRAVVPDNVDPLSYFLASSRNNHDPFEFGVGSVVDGTFGGRQPTCEQLLLFRSHRLMQAEAVSIAMGNVYSSSVFERQRLSLIGSTVTHKAWMKVVEKTNFTVERIRALARNGMQHKQQEIIDDERKICNRMIADILDSATRTLKEMSHSGCSISSGSGCSGGGGYGSTSSNGLFGNTSSGNSYVSTPALEPGLLSETGNRLLAFLPSTLEPPPPSEPHQLASNPAWEDAGSTSCVAMAPLPPITPPITTPSPPQLAIISQQQPIMPSPGSMMDHSSGFALTKVRDCLRTNKKSPMVAKMGAKAPVELRSAHSNRKGSRHRLTLQAKEILEGWLAKHWLNPYPTEEDKMYLAQACKITVSQVNNWMMNVRVRRCRTKKIGVATGPGRITFANFPNAIEESMPKGMAAAEAEDLLADETASMGTKEATSTAIFGGNYGKPLEKSWRGGK